MMGGEVPRILNSFFKRLPDFGDVDDGGVGWAQVALAFGKIRVVPAPFAHDRQTGELAVEVAGGDAPEQAGRAQDAKGLDIIRVGRGDDAHPVSL